MKLWTNFFFSSLFFFFFGFAWWESQNPNNLWSSYCELKNQWLMKKKNWLKIVDSFCFSGQNLDQKRNFYFFHFHFSFHFFRRSELVIENWDLIISYFGWWEYKLIFVSKEFLFCQKLLLFFNKKRMKKRKRKMKNDEK